jgi:hypothetical protein
MKAVSCPLRVVIRLALCTMLFVFCGSAEAQRPKKLARIGYLSASSLGGIPRRHFARDYENCATSKDKTSRSGGRFAQGIPDQVRRNAAEVVR